MKKKIYIPILSRICVTPSLAVKGSKATKKKLLPSLALSLLGCENVNGNKNICCHLPALSLQILLLLQHTRTRRKPLNAIQLFNPCMNHSPLTR